jgi:hypothetical protein
MTIKDRVTTKFFDAAKATARLVQIVSAYFAARKAVTALEGALTGKIDGTPEGGIDNSNSGCLVCGQGRPVVAHHKTYGYAIHSNYIEHTDDCPVGQIVNGFNDPRVRALLIEAAKTSGEFAYANSRDLTGPNTVNLYRKAADSPTGVQHWFSVGRDEYNGTVYSGPCRGSY